MVDSFDGVSLISRSVRSCIISSSSLPVVDAFAEAESPDVRCSAFIVIPGAISRDDVDPPPFTVPPFGKRPLPSSLPIVDFRHSPFCTLCDCILDDRSRSPSVFAKRARDDDDVAVRFDIESSTCNTRDQPICIMHFSDRCKMLRHTGTNRMANAKKRNYEKQGN
jgi:hypothetical protein